MNETPPSSFPQRTQSCPEEELLASYVERRLSDPGRQQVEAHVSTCEYCVAQVGFLLEVEDAALPRVPAALLERVAKPAPAPPWWSMMGWRWAPAAAALAGVVVVGAVLMQRDAAVPANGSERPPARQQAPASAPAVSAPAPGPVAPTSSDSSPRQTRSQGQTPEGLQLLQPRAGAAVSAQGFDLRWTKVPGALFYELRLTTPNGQLMWSSKVEQEQVRVPADAGLRPGAYFAMVRAQLPEGRLIRAQAVSFTVRE